MSSPRSIAEYLDELAGLLTSSGMRQRAFLLEVEAHLQDARDVRVASGDSPPDAEAAAISAFGRAWEVARAENRADWRAVRGPVAAEAALLILRLTAIGMVVVGMAGALTRVISSFGLLQAMYGLPANVIMPAASCAHWMAVQPGATTCAQAGTLEAADDLTGVALVVGLLGLSLWIPMAARSWRRRRPPSVLPPTLGPALAAAVFGAAGSGFFVLGATNAVVAATWGRGMWLTYAACAAAACIASVVMLVKGVYRSYRSAPATSPRP